MGAECLGHPSVAARQAVSAITIARVGHVVAVAAHDGVVQDDRQNRQPLAHRGLHLHANRAEGEVAHDVDHRLVRLGQFCTEGEAQARAELG